MALVDDITGKVREYLEDAGLDVQLEKGIGKGHRVDLYAEIDDGFDIGIEVKTSKEDLKTGYGRNFDFFVNYIAVPKKLAVYVFGLKYLKDIPEHVGVIVYMDTFPHELFLAEPAKLNPSWGNVGCFPMHFDIYSPFADNKREIGIMSVREAM